MNILYFNQIYSLYYLLFPHPPQYEGSLEKLKIEKRKLKVEQSANSPITIK
jgi:hypothetical protein